MSYFNNQTPNFTPEMLDTLVRCLKRDDVIENNKAEVLSDLKLIMDCANVMYRELEEVK